MNKFKLRVHESLAYRSRRRKPFIGLVFVLWVTAHTQPAVRQAQAEQVTDAAPNQRMPAGSPTKQPFLIQQDGWNAWLVKPNGERFFSFGVNCVDRGLSKKEYDRRNPGYAAWQHYRDPNQWAGTTLGRLKSWGFTTIGGWSDFHTLRQHRDADVAFTPVLHIGSTAGAPWWDMWDPKIIARMDQVARDQILPLRDDPRLLGYYSDNELGWWNAAMFKMTLEQLPSSGQRQRLMELLLETYHHDWTELLRDFEPEGAGSWQELERGGRLYLRPGGNGMPTLRRFLGLVAERYYSLVHDIIRKYDRRALFLGDRYQSFFYPEVVKAAAPFVDVVSTNLNAIWNDGTFPRFYLETLHGLSGKPILISEFYMAAKENRSGNLNDHGIFPLVATQQERAVGFRNTVLALASIPYVVGADWFQYYDEPGRGRGDGENFNFGLVDIHDRPYEELVRTAAGLLALKKAKVEARLDASEGIPRAALDPLGQFRPLLALKNWDRERGFIQPNSPFPTADLYICWKEEALYLGLQYQDPIEDAYYRDKMIPESDRALWTIAISGTRAPLHARIGGGREPVVEEAQVRIVGPPGRGVGNTVALEIPAKILGKESLQAGDRIEFSSHLLTHARAYRVEWKGSFVLR